MFLYSYNSFDAFVFCVVVYLIHALINICLFDAHMTPTHFTHMVCNDPPRRYDITILKLRKIQFLNENSVNLLMKN